MAKSVSGPTTMEELVEALGDKLVPFTQGDVVDVTVISTSKDSIMVDVSGVATGIIPEKEFSATASKIKTGDTIRAFVMSSENSNGYVILSLKRAEKERLWNMLEQRNTTGEVISVKIVQANKGGLVAEYGNMQGFIPVSQLSFKNYPRVEGDRSKIQEKLSELIGQSIVVKIISYDKASNKIVFSEKAAGDVEAEEKASHYQVGQKVKGKITGIVDFGLFVDIGEIEGLIHISQVSWQRINNLKDHFQVGQEIEAEVVSVEGGRISLSIKKLQSDPWQLEVKTLGVGDKVEGEVTKVTPYGAFVRLTDSLEGLFHVSQMPEQTPVEQAVKENQKYLFEVVSIEPELRKISLRLANTKVETKKKSSSEDSSASEVLTKEAAKDEKPAAKAKAKPKKKPVSAEPDEVKPISKTASSDKVNKDASAQDSQE
ncbi:MAG TPA: S1 RNA-binding domain-containing protein [Candidatus Saccharimonadales bacterium]|nr:S1 RNA-binding domain-containing protein [Candidatus Saccharimonadales bacterium]